MLGTTIEASVAHDGENKQEANRVPVLVQILRSYPKIYKNFQRKLQEKQEEEMRNITQFSEELSKTNKKNKKWIQKSLEKKANNLLDNLERIQKDLSKKRLRNNDEDEEVSFVLMREEEFSDQADENPVIPNQSNLQVPVNVVQRSNFQAFSSFVTDDAPPSGKRQRP